MKKLFTFLAILSTITCLGQSTQSAATIFNFLPSVNQRIHTGDSVQPSASLFTTGAVQGISWTQTAGPATLAINPIPYWYGSVFESSPFWIQPSVAGIYVFKATGTALVNGSTMTGTLVDSITVVPNPAPRTVTSITLPVPAQTLTILGQTLTIPAQTLTLPASGLPAGSILYSDGSKQ